MPRSGKSLLKLFKRSSSSPSTPPPHPQPPNAFLCPISGSLMANPVIIPTGHTFERAAIEACELLNFIPPILSPISSTDFLSFSLTPNLALKTAILDWCNLVGHPHPLPLSQAAACGIIEQLKAVARTEVGTSNQEPLEPEVTLTTELEIFAQLQAADSIQESAVLILNRTARESRERVISLCTERIVTLIIPMLYSLNSRIQIKATAVISKFAFEEPNRSKIIRWRVVPALLHVLSEGVLDARENAASVIYDLTREEENRMIIGKAMPLLLKNFCDRFLCPKVRRHAGQALINLTLSPLVLPLFEEMQAVPKLLEVATDKSSDEVMGLTGRAIEIMYNLTEGSKGREELMDAGVVDVMLRMIREEEGRDVNCLTVMHWICMHCPSRFRELAISAGAEEVLAKEKREWGQEGKMMAKQMLDVILKREGSIQEAESLQLLPEVKKWEEEEEEQEEEEEEEEQEEEEEEEEQEEQEEGQNS